MLINPRELIGRRVLMSRESGRILRQAVIETLKDRDSEVIVDLAGIGSFAPSFMDEFLFLFEELAERGRRIARVVFVGSPLALSDAYRSIAESHDAVVAEASCGTWEFVASGVATR